MQKNRGFSSISRNYIPGYFGNSLEPGIKHLSQDDPEKTGMAGQYEILTTFFHV